MTCRLISILFLTLSLSACNDSDESDPLSRVFLTFYPSAESFPSEASDQQVINFKRLLIANGVERVNVTVNQRKDAQAPLDEEQKPAYQYAVFRVSFSNSNTFDVYDENENILYTSTVFTEDNEKHFCIAIDEQEQQLIETDLPMSFPSDNSEAHQFIKHCRELYSQRNT
ncbi:hypothetical protein [Agarivorans sp. 1_MG-2023]|uniref:hypothetical protein n=1 Tax=Agarivorans sp. 1_MG-2023 TaxID=3062634 RepID=UPI0026E176CB|nr:hypothetical protein [Agarivorans sp. 1_MG-2023]MDO6765931.1 hypothetical protein [Agarivorans sp. 1_MG-2023]